MSSQQNSNRYVPPCRRTRARKQENAFHSCAENTTRLPKKFSLEKSLEICAFPALKNGAATLNKDTLSSCDLASVPPISGESSTSKQKMSFLKATDTKVNIARSQDPSDLDIMHNLPEGWVRLSHTKPYATEEFMAQEKQNNANVAKEHGIKEIWRMLKARQNERDIQNELLGELSPYYNLPSLLDLSADLNESDYESEYDDDDDYEDE